MAKETRKGSNPIRVWVTPDEKALIETHARQTGHSTSAYLRLLGLGYALLKLWLTNDARTAQFGDNVIRATLARIEDTQVQMVEVMKTIILPRSKL